MTTLFTLKCRRLKWARQELTLDAQQGGRPTARGLIFEAKRMLAAGGYKKGFVPYDTPAHRRVGELLKTSWKDWDEPINKLDTRSRKKAAADVDRCSKTGAEYIQQMKTNLEFTG